MAPRVSPSAIVIRVQGTGAAGSGGRVVSRMIRAFVASVGLLLLSASTANAEGPNDFAATALNILPSGQYGSVPPPAGRRPQAQMYDGLTPLFDQVTDADIDQGLQVRGASASAPTGPARPRAFRAPASRSSATATTSLTSTRTTYDDGIWAAGWIAAEDRGLLLAAGALQRTRRRDRRPRAQRDRPDQRTCRASPRATDRGRAREADQTCC